MIDPGAAALGIPLIGRAGDLGGVHASLPSEISGPDRPANGRCIDCEQILPPQFRGRPRLRCDECRAQAKGGFAERLCLGGCGTDLTGQHARSMCPECAAASKRLAKREPRRNYSRSDLKFLN